MFLLSMVSVVSMAMQLQRTGPVLDSLQQTLLRMPPAVIAVHLIQPRYPCIAPAFALPHMDMTTSQICQAGIWELSPACRKCAQGIDCNNPEPPDTSKCRKHCVGTAASRIQSHAAEVYKSAGACS